MYLRTAWIQDGVVSSGGSKTLKLSSLRRKIFDHKNSSSHKYAEQVLKDSSNNSLITTCDNTSKHLCATTSRLMRTAYTLAKNNRPYTAYSELCDLQEANGLDLGKGLHSRFSATKIIECIAVEMKSRVCGEILNRNQKLSLMLDESTTISRKSCLIVYLRTKWPGVDNDECFALPLGLVQLESLTASSITNSLMELLKQHGFSSDYLSQSLVGVCSDGASVMLGKNSGVLIRLKEMFPNIVLWHCMCHRIELAVGDAVKSVTQINHVKSFLDKLYKVFSQSPKAQRELESCASSVGTELLKIGKVLDVRWAASSYNSLNAIWRSYPALFKHCTESHSSKQAKYKSMYRGLKLVLESKQFVHTLAVMLDALECLSVLSKALQSENICMGKAYKLVKRTIRILENQKNGIMGDSFKLYNDCIAGEGVFKGVALNNRGSFLRKEAFLQALIDNLNARLYDNIAMKSHEDFESLLSQFDILHKEKVPSSVVSPWLEGESKLLALCQRFHLNFNDYRGAFRDFIDDLDTVPREIMDLRTIVNTLPISSADCERGFSTMNLICSDTRNCLKIENIDSLMFINLVGPPVNKFNPDHYVTVWLRNHRSANDTRTRVSRPAVTTRYENLWSFI